MKPKKMMNEIVTGEKKRSQKKDTNKRPSEIRNIRKTRKKIINKISYFCKSKP